MKKILILILGILLVTFESCKNDDEIIQLDPPQISITNGSNASIERGQSVSVSLKLEAQAGIDNLTMNGELVNGINSGETEQSINVSLETTSESDLGNTIYDFVLTDQQGETATTQFTLLISPGGIVQSDTVSLYDNSVLIDESIELVSSDEQINSGVFVFSSTELDIKTGDVIAGPQNGGYLRLVESIEADGNQTTLTTSQAVVTDLFKDTQINLEFGRLIEDTNGRTLGETSFREDFTDLTLIEENGSSLQVNGFVELDANYNLSLNIENGSLVSADFSTSGTTLDLSLLTSIEVSDNLEVANSEYEILQVTKPFYSVSPPVYGTVNFKLKSVVSASVDASVSADITTRDKVEIDFNASYQNGSWTESLSTQELISEGSADLSGVINISNEIKLVPEIDIKLYGVSGPYFKAEAFATLDIGVSSPSLDWDAYSEIGYGGVFGFQSDILGDILNFESMIEGEKFKVWEAPASLEIVSGNNQQISQNSQSAPLIVQVVDNLGNPISGVPVYYNLIQGSGSIEATEVTTDENGNSQNLFTSDINEGQNLIRASIRNRDQSEIASKDFSIETNLNCTGVEINISATIDQNGTIEVTANGGTAPYDYSVDSSEFQESNLFPNNYSEGEYEITVIDSNGCKTTELITVQQTQNWYIVTLTASEEYCFESEFINCQDVSNVIGDVFELFLKVPCPNCPLSEFEAYFNTNGQFLDYPDLKGILKLTSISNRDVVPLPVGFLNNTTGNELNGETKSIAVPLEISRSSGDITINNTFREIGKIVNTDMVGQTWVQDYYRVLLDVTSVIRVNSRPENVKEDGQYCIYEGNGQQECY